MRDIKKWKRAGLIRHAEELRRQVREAEDLAAQAKQKMQWWISEATQLRVWLRLAEVEREAYRSQLRAELFKNVQPSTCPLDKRE